MQSKLVVSPAALGSLALLSRDIGPVEIIAEPRSLANGTAVEIVACPLPDDSFRTGVERIVVRNSGDAIVVLTDGRRRAHSRESLIADARERATEGAVS